MTFLFVHSAPPFFCFDWGGNAEKKDLVSNLRLTRSFHFLVTSSRIPRHFVPGGSRLHSQWLVLSLLEYVKQKRKSGRCYVFLDEPQEIDGWDAPRKAETHKPRIKEPNRFWGIDMTKVMIPAFGWVYLHVVLDWGTKKLLSTHLSLTSKASDWIFALNEAVNLQFPDGIRGAEFIPYLVSDHGCQPTSTSFFNPCFSKCAQFSGRYLPTALYLFPKTQQK